MQDDRHRGLSRALQSASSSSALVDSPSSQERKDVAQPQQNGSSRAANTKSGSTHNEHAKAVRKLSSEPMFAGYCPDVVARSNTEQTGSPRVLTSHARTKRKTSAPNVPTKTSPSPTAQETPSTVHQTLLTSIPPSPERERLVGSNGSLGMKHSYEEAISFRSALSSSLSTDYPSSLVSAMEAVNLSLEEPKGVYGEKGWVGGLSCCIVYLCVVCLYSCLCRPPSPGVPADETGEVPAGEPELPVGCSAASHTLGWSLCRQLSACVCK